MQPTRGALGCVALSLLGLGLCVWLSVLHIAMLRGEFIGGIACGAEGSLFNCHAVTGGRFGSFLGVPLSLWGLIGYLILLGLALIGWQVPEQSTNALAALCLMALVFVLVDLFLFWQMVVTIRRLCPLCLATYAVNLSLLVVAKRAVGTPWARLLTGIPQTVGALLPKRHAAVLWLFWGWVVTSLFGTAALHAATTYLSIGSLGNVRQQVRQFLGQQTRVSVETSGDPRLGESTAPVQLVEFSDFLCPACQRASKMNPIILANHRGQVSFVFKQFPLDLGCNDKIPRMVHPGACQIAAATECAHQQGKFWAFHDRIFEKKHPYNLSDLEGDAQAVGLDLLAFRTCLSSGEGLRAVKRDIAQAGALGVLSTPTYIVDGYKIPGVLSSMTFGTLLEAIREQGG